MKPIISVLNAVHLLPETQAQLQALASRPFTFPADSPTDLATLIARTGQAQVILVSPSTQLTLAYFDACPTVKHVAVCGTSTTGIDPDALATHHINLTNVTDYGDEPTAEFIFMQLIALARGIGPYQWQDQPRELYGKTIGILGLGALGRAVAHLALALGMHVQYYSRTRQPDQESRGVVYATLDHLIRSSNIIVICTPSNLRILEADHFNHIPDGTILVQASLGTTFDQPAFERWIARDRNFAIFDYAAGDPLYQAYHRLPRVIFPKIVAGHTYETRLRLGQKLLTNLKNIVKN